MASRQYTRASKRVIQQHIEAQRRRLLGADAIVVCVRAALDSRLDAPDEVRVGDALQVASDLINHAVVQLDSVNLSKHGGGVS